MTEASSSSKSTVPRRTVLTRKDKEVLVNVYNTFVAEKEDRSVKDTVSLTCNAIGVCRSTVYNVLKEYKVKEGQLTPPKIPSGRPAIEVDDISKNAIRKIVHSFFFENQHPTVAKVLTEIRKNSNIPKMGKTKLKETLRDMNFRYRNRNRNSLLIERNEIIVWRRTFLRAIKKYREEGRTIYYLDETWVTAGHTVSKLRVDENTRSARQAAIEELPVGMKTPSSKGNRLIAAHVGSDDGFLDNSLLIFECKKNSADYHDEMNSTVFEPWFISILKKMEPHSVIVMDNASYHSRKDEEIPSTSTGKDDIHAWLTKHSIKFDDDMVRAELLNIVKTSGIKSSHVTDKIAINHEHEILRLPPYHCELNPFELIWAQTKNEVARKNTSYKFSAVKKLFENAVTNVTKENWVEAIDHVKEVEKKLWDLDGKMEIQIESQLANSSSSEDSSEEDKMFYHQNGSYYCL